MLRWSLAALLLAGLVSAAAANPPAPPPIRRPHPAAGKEVKLVVEVDPAATQPRLVIPRSLVGAGAPASSTPRGFGAASLPTVVAALALTLGLASGGFWLVRKGKGRTAAALVVLSAFALGGAALWADIAQPPPKKEPIKTVKLPANVKLPDRVRIEVVDKGDAIKLIVGKGGIHSGGREASEE